jgi:hypothetical protein
MSVRMDFLEGAVDLHVHSSPDLDPRRYDDIELAREARKAGMSAILIKSHQNSTVERASLVSRIVEGIQVFGGLVLNETIGGLNPAAVKLALQLGARQIWMPTRSAFNHRRFYAQSGGIKISDESGRLVPAVEEILRLLAPSGCILGTGHLSPEEGALLIQRAQEAGVTRVMVTHPEWAGTHYSNQLQKQLATRYLVCFERCFVSTTHRCGHVPFDTIAKAIADAGVDSTVVSTDLGQPDTPAPVEGLRLFAERLLGWGFSPDDVRRMMQSNPQRLLL